MPYKNGKELHDVISEVLYNLFMTAAQYKNQLYIQ